MYQTAKITKKMTEKCRGYITATLGFIYDCEFYLNEAIKVETDEDTIKFLNKNKDLLRELKEKLKNKISK